MMRQVWLITAVCDEEGRGELKGIRPAAHLFPSFW